MDTIIEEEVTRKKRRKFFLVSIVILLVIVILIIGLRNSLDTSILSSQITTGIVDQGSIENTISASGEILPEFEQVISSPIDASIQKVILDQGAKVDASQPNSS